MHRGIGIAHADIHHGHSQARHLSDPLRRLAQIRLKGIVFRCSPGAQHRRPPFLGLSHAGTRSLAKRNTVKNVHARGNDEAGNFTANSADDVLCQPGAIFQAAAIGTRTGFCRQQLAQEISMALLDIHKLETDLVRQPSRGDIIICQALEAIVI